MIISYIFKILILFFIFLFMKNYIKYKKNKISKDVIQDSLYIYGILSLLIIFLIYISQKCL